MNELPEILAVLMAFSPLLYLAFKILLAWQLLRLLEEVIHWLRKH